MKGAIIAIGSILLIACIFTFPTRLELIVKKVHIPAGLLFGGQVRCSRVFGHRQLLFTPHPALGGSKSIEDHRHL